ncbi:protein-L-isoaspartate(D-aspartate) O-methyltransferase [Haloechinothrix alba]|uniref:Protein-L-isoaspartate O-methyltransferase n=1 Tax=Haloechinothrix alba TaxID=664784 RepID=A0A238YA90_9PSEU|nr:methyltransferase domain-containing protein [Haloechinothrix alba]SNR68057.1 protein-L-isoaspartate(D-aspartate) O-methyltransferase [Haloechinothrix alba]
MTRAVTDWFDLLAEVPREPFLPDIVWTDGSGRTFVPVSRASDPQLWAKLTRGDQPVITQVDDGYAARHGVTPTSSASMPSVVAGMLDALDVQCGDNVLEIGTGTGWNAALLAHRAGERGRVISVEIDPAVADNARRALRAEEADVEVITANGEYGYPPAAPYDRVIATASARHIPHSWVAQTRVGGIVVAPWGTDYCSALARLQVTSAGHAVGSFSAGYAFMRLRSQRRSLTHADGGALDMSSADHSLTELDASDLYRMVAASKAAFTIGLLVPQCRMHYEEDARGHNQHIVELHDSTSRSWAQVDVDLDHGTPFDVYQQGPRRLWDEAVAGYRWWQQHCTPDPSQFGITIAEDEQAIWLNSQDGEYRWTLAP